MSSKSIQIPAAFWSHLVGVLPAPIPSLAKYQWGWFWVSCRLGLPGQWEWLQESVLCWKVFCQPNHLPFEILNQWNTIDLHSSFLLPRQDCLPFPHQTSCLPYLVSAYFPEHKNRNLLAFGNWHWTEDRNYLDYMRICIILCIMGFYSTIALCACLPDPYPKLLPKSRGK